MRFACSFLFWSLALSCAGRGNPADAGAEASPDGTSPADVAADVGAPSPFLNGQRGDPGLQSISRIAFDRAGLLYVADGESNRVVGIDLQRPGGDQTLSAPIDAFGRRVADALGGGIAASDIVFNDVAVDPVSHQIHVAVTRRSTREDAMLRVAADGTVELVPHTDVSFAAVGFATGVGSSVSDMVWTRAGLVLSAQHPDWTSATVVVVPVPLTHGDPARVTTTRTYHRTHVAWETMAPIDRLAAFEDGGESFVAATFTCTPFVRFRVADLSSGMMQITGETPFDLGPGKQVREVIVYERGGQRAIVATVYSGFTGTSFATRVDGALLSGTAIDRVAPVLFGASETPTNTAATRVASLDNVALMAVLDADRAVVLRATGRLELVPLP